MRKEVDGVLELVQSGWKGRESLYKFGSIIAYIHILFNLSVLLKSLRQIKQRGVLMDEYDDTCIYEREVV